MMTAPEPDGIVWHTSSYSSNDGACIEVGWRTSSYSSNGGTCIEVALHPRRHAGPRLQKPALAPP